MRARVQSVNYYLYQLEKDNAELLREFAELATLGELVRQTEAALHAKPASRERSTTVFATKSGDPFRRAHRTG
jgi:hypothetical protein